MTTKIRDAALTERTNLHDVRHRLRQISEAGRRRDLARAVEVEFGCDITVPIGPTIQAEELAQLEAKHGIALPAEYRQFVTEVANGGLGPFHGMMTLQASLGQTAGLQEDFHPGERVGRAHGAIPMCDYGCGMLAVLVLNGYARSEIWMDDPNVGRVDPWWRYRKLNGRLDDIGTDLDSAPERPYRFLDWFDEWATCLAAAVSGV